MPVLRRVGKYYKPTTVFLQKSGKNFSKNRISLNREDLKKFLDRIPIIIDDSINIEVGFVLVLDEDKPLGCGFFDGRSLHSRLPKFLKRDRYLLI